MRPSNETLRKRLLYVLCNMKELLSFMRKTNTGGSSSKESLKRLYYQLSLTVDACSKCVDELTPKKQGRRSFDCQPSRIGGEMMSTGLTKTELRSRYLNADYWDHDNIYSDLLTVAHVAYYFITEEGENWAELKGRKDDIMQFHLGLSLVMKCCAAALARLMLNSLKDEKAAEKIKEMVDL